MKLFLSISLVALLIPAVAQVTFDKGYIIDNDGKKTECLIENKDLIFNLRTFQYKLSEDERPRQASVQDVREFEIYNFARYVSASVEIDTSGSVVVDRYSSSKNPEWKEETVFLKVLVDGKATLYYYESLNMVRFFFKTEKNPTIRQLIFKEYLVSGSSTGENAAFRQQLFLNVNCGNIPSTYFERMNYRLVELKKHFVKYNACMGGGEVVKSTTQSTSISKRRVFNFSIAPGVNYSSLAVRNTVASAYDVSINGNLYFRLGLQMEYVFPFNRNKWSMFVEPTYQTYKASASYATNRSITANYSSIEFPIGLRYYLFLKGGSKIFIDGFFVPNLVGQLSNATVVYKEGTIQYPPIDLKSSATLGTGIGYSMGAFSMEARYYGATDLLLYYSYFRSEYNRSALIVAYRFLSVKK